MHIPEVMLQAMQVYSPTEENKWSAIEAAIQAGERFVMDTANVTQESVNLDELRWAALEVWTLYMKVSHSRLLPKELREQFPPLYSQEHGEDPLVICKFFTPDADWTWYPMEFDGLNTFFGYVVGQDKELGCFLLSNLETTKGPLGASIERDLQFPPTLLSEVRKLHSNEDVPRMPIMVGEPVELGEEDVAAQAFDREFIAVSICRDDLVDGLGATVKHLQFLTNEDMERIATFVGEAYVLYGRFWEDLLEATNRLLTEKGGPRLTELLTEEDTEEETN